MSEGRTIVGCGAGWMKEEFEALEAKPYEDRGHVTDEHRGVQGALDKPRQNTRVVTSPSTT